MQVCQLIGASIVLHNHCVLNKIPLLTNDENDLLNFVNDDMTSPNDILDFTCGITTRENLILNYFSH